MAVPKKKVNKKRDYTVKTKRLSIKCLQCGAKSLLQGQVLCIRCRVRD